MPCLCGCVLLIKLFDMKKKSLYALVTALVLIGFFVVISVLSTHSIDDQHHKLKCEDLFIEYQSSMMAKSPTERAQARVDFLAVCPEYKNRV